MYSFPAMKPAPTCPARGNSYLRGTDALSRYAIFSEYGVSNPRGKAIVLKRLLQQPDFLYHPLPGFRGGKLKGNPVGGRVGIHPHPELPDIGGFRFPGLRSPGRGLDRYAGCYRVGYPQQIQVGILLTGVVLTGTAVMSAPGMPSQNSRRRAPVAAQGSVVGSVAREARYGTGTFGPASLWGMDQSAAGPSAAAAGAVK